MGEPAKAISSVPQKTTAEDVVIGGRPRIKVSRLVPKESVELRPFGNQVNLYTQRPGLAIAGMGVSDLDMELDRTVGGVVIRYSHQSDKYCCIVPMSNIKVMEVAE